MTKQEKFDSYVDSMRLDASTASAIKEINSSLFESNLGRKKIGGFSKPVEEPSLDDILGEGDEPELGISLQDVLNDGIEDVNGKVNKNLDADAWNKNDEKSQALKFASRDPRYMGLLDADGKKFSSNAFKVPFIYNYGNVAKDESRDCPEEFENSGLYAWISGDKLPAWQDHVTKTYDMDTAKRYIDDIEVAHNVDDVVASAIKDWKDSGSPKYDGEEVPFAEGDGTGIAKPDNSPNINIVKRKETTDKEKAIRWAVTSKMFDGYLLKKKIIDPKRRIPEWSTNGPMYKFANFDGVTEGGTELPCLYFSRANLEKYLVEHEEEANAMKENGYKPIAISDSKFVDTAMSEWKNMGEPDYNSLIDMNSGSPETDNNIAEVAVNAMNSETFDGWISRADIIQNQRGDYVLNTKSTTYNELNRISDYVKTHPECRYRYVATKESIAVNINGENANMHLLIYVGSDIKNKGEARFGKRSSVKIVGYFDDEFLQAGGDITKIIGDGEIPNIIEGPVLIMGAETEISSNVKLNNCTIVNTKLNAAGVMNGIVIGKGAKLINSSISVDAVDGIQVYDKTIDKTIIMGGMITNTHISGGYAEIEMSELDNLELTSGSAKILSGVSIDGNNCQLSFTDGNAVILKSRYNYKAGYEKDITRDGDREYHKKIWGSDESSTLKLNGNIIFNTENGNVSCTASVLTDVVLNGPCNVKLSDLKNATVGTEGSSNKTNVFGVDCVEQTGTNSNEVIICGGANVGEDKIEQKHGVKLVGNVRIEGGTSIGRSNIASGSYVVSGMTLSGCNYGLTQPEALEIANYLDKSGELSGDMSNFDIAEERFIKAEHKTNAEDAVSEIVNGTLDGSGWKSVPFSYVRNYMLESLPIMNEKDKVNSVFMEPSSDGRFHYSENLYLTAWDKLCGLCRFKLGAGKSGNEVVALGILVKRPNVVLHPDKINTRTDRFRAGKYDPSWKYQPDIEGFDGMIYGYYLDGKINLRTLINGLKDGNFVEAFTENMEEPDVIQYFIVPCSGKFNGIKVDGGDVVMQPISKVITPVMDAQLRKLNADVLNSFMEADTDTTSAMDRYSKGDVNNGGVKTAVCKANGEMTVYTYDNKTIMYSAPKFNVSNGRMEVTFQKNDNDEHVTFLGTGTVACAEDPMYREGYEHLSDSVKKNHGGSSIIYAALNNQNPVNRTTQRLNIDKPWSSEMPEGDGDAFTQSIMNKLRNVSRYQSRLYYRPFFNKKTNTWKGIGIVYDEANGGWRYYSPAHPAQLMKSPDSIMPTTININPGDQLTPAKYSDMVELGMLKK